MIATYNVTPLYAMNMCVTSADNVGWLHIIAYTVVTITYNDITTTYTYIATAYDDFTANMAFHSIKVEYVKIRKIIR